MKPIEDVARIPERPTAAQSSTSATAATWISRSKCRATSWAPSPPTRCGTRSTTALAELIREHRTTLVFVNTRRLAERVAHHLGERLGEDAVLPHHGSLSRALRLEAEQRLKARRTARRGRHRVARAGHRHRHGRPGLPDRLAALDRGRAAARRPRRALGGRAARRAASSPPRATS